MDTLKFREGDKMAAVGLGTWKAKPKDVKEAVLSALKVGYTHIDCASIYGNEKAIGEVFLQAFKDGLIERENLWVTSKLWNDSHKKEDVMPALKQTLKDLQLDYLDLYLMHWPVAFKKGVDFPQKPDDFYKPTEVPISETWKAMEELVDKGLVKHIGVSNFNGQKLKELHYNARIKPEMNQVELHPYLSQNGLKAACDEMGVHMAAYSPLGSRDRSQQMKKDDEPNLFDDDTIKQLAEKYNCHEAQILIGWAVKRGTAVIPKSTDEDHMKKNLEAVEINFSEGDILALSNLEQHYRFVDGTFWEMEGLDFKASHLW